MKYPYIVLPGSPKSATAPLLEVIYKHRGKRTTPILALVDSGASVSFAPLDLGLWLGIKIDNKHPLDIKGFNNASTICYPGRVIIEIGSYNAEILIYFGGGPKFPCILGQDSFFNIAKITFEKYANFFSVDWIKEKNKQN